MIPPDSGEPRNKPLLGYVGLQCHSEGSCAADSRASTRPTHAHRSSKIAFYPGIILALPKLMVTPFIELGSITLDYGLGSPSLR